MAKSGRTDVIQALGRRSEMRGSTKVRSFRTPHASSETRQYQLVTDNGKSTNPHWIVALVELVVSGYHDCITSSLILPYI